VGQAAGAGQPVDCQGKERGRHRPGGCPVGPGDTLEALHGAIRPGEGPLAGRKAYAKSTFFHSLLRAKPMISDT
jgi:hypothetical protein